MLWRSRLGELRTMLTGVDPGLVRFRLGAVAVASMLLAVGVMEAISTPAGEPVTVVLMAAVLSMISNLAVVEPEIRRLRVTTALMVPPALVAVTAGTLLAPYRIPADVVFVAIMVGAVWVRRYGPRGNALGMAAMMAYFFTQFLRAAAAQIPFLLVAVAVGIGATLLLRGFVLPEHADRTVERMARAFRAHVHGLVEAVADLLLAAPDDVDDALRSVARRRTRLNDTALLVADRLEQQRDDEREHLRRHGRPDRPPEAEDGARETFELALLDAELAAERLSVATRRMVQDDRAVPDDVRRPLLAGVRAVGAATATGTARGIVPTLLDGARTSVASIVAETDGLGDRPQRVAFAVVRLADALDTGGGARPAAEHPEGHPVADTLPDEAPEPVDAAPAGLGQSTRQAVQVGVATSLAIVLGELVSPARWYWAVITAFVVFANTTSRGDLLSRGSQRVVGTVGGVLAGMALAFVVGDRALPALILLFVCVFFALYLVRVSQTMLAFWITAVLALLYGVIGQFSVETLLLRVEETAIGAATGMFAGFVILPKGTREAFGEALEEMVDATNAALAGAVARMTGHAARTAPLELARDMDDALSVLRLRAKPLDNPLPRRRGRSSYVRALRVLTGVDHYVRRLARMSDDLVAPDWAPTLDPAAQRVRANIEGLSHLVRGREHDAIRSAEDLVDAAEAFAARTADHRRRAELLSAVRMLRRIDQAVVGFTEDLEGRRPQEEPPHPVAVPQSGGPG